MSGIAVFVPDKKMDQQVKEQLEEREYHVKIVKTVQPEEAVYEARQAVSEHGVNIIAARGRLAEEIRRYTNVAVAEIPVTAQEMGLLVNWAREVLERDRPGKSLRITVFYWGNMLCDTTYFNDLYGISLVRVRLEEDNWRSIFMKACNEGTDAVIGDREVAEEARSMGILAFDFLSTPESLRSALDYAESLYHMAEVEQRNYAQFSTILDSSFHGIMRVTESGAITAMNRAMEQTVGLKQDQAAKRSVQDLFPDLDQASLMRVLEGKMENFTTFVRKKDQTLVVVMEPIMVEGNAEGAILSCSRLQRLELEEKKLGEQYLRGYTAYETFEEIEKEMPELKDALQKARLYAQSSSPVLIEGYTGPEQDAICQGIHNYSLRKNGPYIVINLAGMSEDQQMHTLFWGVSSEHVSGAAEQADKGTLVIQSIDKMTLPVQYHFSKMLLSKKLQYGSIENTKIIDIRIIACTSKDIDTCRRMNRMRSDLYYALKALKVHIPPLCQRRGDTERLLERYMKEYMEQYYRYHRLTAGARSLLLEYDWPGNSIQLKAFCERMILTADRRTITEEYVRELLEELYAHTQEPDYYVQHGLEAPDAFENKQTSDGAVLSPGQKTEKDQIREALVKYRGNRGLTAKELGISTTTLWRRIKEYKLEE